MTTHIHITEHDRRQDRKNLEPYDEKGHRRRSHHRRERGRKIHVRGYTKEDGTRVKGYSRKK